jgi:hypothetical protein
MKWGKWVYSRMARKEWENDDKPSDFRGPFVFQTHPHINKD